MLLALPIIFRFQYFFRISLQKKCCCNVFKKITLKCTAYIHYSKSMLRVMAIIGGNRISSNSEWICLHFSLCLMLLEKTWIQFFYSQLWANNRTDGAFYNRTDWAFCNRTDWALYNRSDWATSLGEGKILNSN